MTFLCKITKLSCFTSSTLVPPSSSAICHISQRYSTQKSENFDIVVIGGGIVGSASARELQKRHTGMKIALVEKENCFAMHQSGNNSGVIHAGIYYKPGSLKAKLCVQGLDLAYKYCDEKKINYSRCGKLIVASNRSEVPRLLELYERGLKNGVKDMRLMDLKEMREIEPYCKGVQALWSPNTGVISWGLVTQHYVKDFQEMGGKTYLNFEVKQFLDAEKAEYPVTITNKKDKTIHAKYVLTCCGLHSDTVAMLTGCPEEPKIIPFRGEYLYIIPSKTNIVKSNIYPVPDPRFPFLGVHITPTVGGRVILGPNAILAFCKEGYKYTDINLRELKDVLAFSGFRQLALKYATFGMKEMMRSVIMTLQVREVQKYLQELTTSDCERGPAGVRAQALGKDGTLIEDFVFDSQAGTGAIGSRVLHCRNAPSPGATSSLAIAIMIADKMEKHFKLEKKMATFSKDRLYAER